MGQISLELSNRLSAAVERMPAFPKSVQRILELTRNIDCEPRDLVAVIQTDPVIAIKVLKVVNSSYYSLPSKITSINQSVVYLGLNTIKNLALNFSVMGMLPHQNAARFDIQQYLKHSLLTANLMRLLAGKFSDDETNDAYMAGLLHDFGKVVFAQFMPQEFLAAMSLSSEQQIEDYLAEERVIGADHAFVGAMLTERWQFPAELVECIREHHHNYASSALGECLYVADILATQMGIDGGENLEQALTSQPLPERFSQEIDNLLAALDDHGKLMNEADMFCSGAAFK
ncbi:MAG TPA: HDOD domain-containing protein [Burkholderiaceae bacterium]|nr:HDOD domain-containing protein [Burkholderiaceae bacterium]